MTDAARAVPPEVVLAAAGRCWDGVRDRGWRLMAEYGIVVRQARKGGEYCACRCGILVALDLAGVFRYGRCTKCGVWWWA